LRGRLGQRNLLLERLVITFPLPPWVRGRGQVVKRQGGIARDPIPKAQAAGLVCEDLLDEHQPEVHSFEIDARGGVRFQLQRVHSRIPALMVVGHTQGDLAMGLEGTDKIVVLLLVDEDPGFRRGAPPSEEDKAKREPGGTRLLDPLSTHFVLGHRTAPFFFLRLGVHLLLGLGHQVEAHRQPHPLAAIPRRQEVAPFEQPICGGVVMPPHNIVLVAVRLLLARVVDDQHPRRGLHLADNRLDREPQIGRRFLLARQVSGPLIVADFSLQPLAQSSGRGGAERGQQIIRIHIGYRLCFHTGEFTPFSLPSRKVSYKDRSSDSTPVALSERPGNDAVWRHEVGTG